MMRSLMAGVVLAALVALTGGSTAAQTSVSASDIQRVEEALVALEREYGQLRDRDASAAGQHQASLNEVREEVIYLRVAHRRGRTVDRDEYREIRDRLDDLRSKVTAHLEPQRPASRPAPAAAQAPPASTPAASSAIPVGTELDVRLQNTLSSGTSQVEDRFIATTTVPLSVDGRELVPAGSEVRGVVSSVDSAGRLNRKASLTLTFDQVTVNGRSYPMRGTLLQAIEGGGYRRDAGRIGTGAGVGAIIGGILGGARGALAGVLIGGGGVVAATEGQEVELPAGTVLRLRLDSPPAIR